LEWGTAYKGLKKKRKKERIHRGPKKCRLVINLVVRLLRGGSD